MNLPPGWYGNLATLVALGHFAFILFVMFGGLLALRWRRAPWLHVPCFLWGGYIELSGGICPLTPLENSLRRAAGATPYAGSFIEHYILPIMYPPGLTRGVQYTLVVGLVLLNLVVYAWVVRRRVAQPPPASPGR
ncbi:MAG TPA: DUF2784 domain-containing protein [Longimicrobiales bacterium]|nr:DUF2784 domain-containing protein [Longimicrobiales bacterium]